MANFFPRWTNRLPLQAVGCLGAVAGFVTLGVWYYFTPKYTRVGYEPDQPVPFSHKIHVEQLGMDCRYCHSFVEIAAHSNVPTTQTCIACHGEGKIQSANPKLAALQESWKAGLPLAWNRVHQLPDYVYFNHAAHVNRGVSCYSCHGDVGAMDVVSQHEPQSMAWCLECHRSPHAFLRPEREVFNMKWRPPVSRPSRADMGRIFQEDWKVDPPVTCGGCHR